MIDRKRETIACLKLAAVALKDAAYHVLRTSHADAGTIHDDIELIESEVRAWIQLLTEKA